MPDFFRKPAKPASSAPSLKTRLRLSIIIVLPLFILGGIHRYVFNDFIILFQ